MTSKLSLEVDVLYWQMVIEGAIGPVKVILPKAEANDGQEGLLNSNHHHGEISHTGQDERTPSLSNIPALIK
jgi:hypothetical protein